MKRLSYRLLVVMLLQLGCSPVGDDSNSGFRAPDEGDFQSLRDLPPSADAPAEPAPDADASDVGLDTDAEVGDTATEPDGDWVDQDSGIDIDATDGSVDVDPCAGLTPCSATEAGSRCEGSTVVICEQSYEGCWFETRQDCLPLDMECVESGSNAGCREPSIGGDTCSEAIPLTPGTHSFDTTTYTNVYEDYAGDCDFTAGWGPEMVFSVDVPAGQSMRATVVPEPSFDVVALISESCPDIEASCLLYADNEFSGDNEVVTIRNIAGSTVTVFLIVDGWGSSSGGFSVAIVIE